MAMEPQVSQRRLSAILVADVAGYSRLMGRDEGQTVRRLKEYRQVFSQRITQSRGRLPWLDPHTGAHWRRGRSRNGSAA